MFQVNQLFCFNLKNSSFSLSNLLFIATSLNKKSIKPIRIYTAIFDGQLNRSGHLFWCGQRVHSGQSPGVHQLHVLIGGMQSDRLQPQLDCGIQHERDGAAERLATHAGEHRFDVDDPQVEQAEQRAARQRNSYQKYTLCESYERKHNRVCI